MIPPQSHVNLVFRYDRGDPRRQASIQAFRRIDLYGDAEERTNAAQEVAQFLDKELGHTDALVSRVDDMLDEFEEHQRERARFAVCNRS